jgi:hypothetical protein
LQTEPVHGEPELHVTQLPEVLHTMLVPQLVPGESMPVATHISEPDVQLFMPVWHGDGVQLPPPVQLTHAPELLHTMPVPQLVPAVSGVPLSMQVGVPPVHEIMPVWHGLVGTHDAPCWQATHAPFAHTIPEPQPVPSGLLPVSVQTGLPVVQEIVASLHAVEPVQLWPELHVTHEPPAQNMLGPPHEVPF